MLNTAFTERMGQEMRIPLPTVLSTTEDFANVIRNHSRLLTTCLRMTDMGNRMNSAGSIADTFPVA